MSLSPEQDRVEILLRGLRAKIIALDPLEHKAYCHIDMSIDPDEDERVLGLNYPYDEELVHESFEELQRYFESDYDMAKALLSELWDVEQRKISFPEDESQHAAIYFAQYKKEEFRVIVTRWTQPKTDTDEVLEMVGACIEPMWSMSPTIHILFVADEPLVSCKFNALDTVNGTDALNPDDVMLAENIVKRVRLHPIFDTPA